MIYRIKEERSNVSSVDIKQIERRIDIVAKAYKPAEVKGAFFSRSPMENEPEIVKHDCCVIL